MKKYNHEFRIELLITPLYVVLAILSIKYIGFFDIQSSIFTIITIIFVPISYYGFRFARKFLYQILKGTFEYENK